MCGRIWPCVKNLQTEEKRKKRRETGLFLCAQRHQFSNTQRGGCRSAGDKRIGEKHAFLYLSGDFQHRQRNDQDQRRTGAHRNQFRFEQPTDRIRKHQAERSAAWFIEKTDQGDHWRSDRFCGIRWFHRSAGKKIFQRDEEPFRICDLDQLKSWYQHYRRGAFRWRQGLCGEVHEAYECV